MPYSRPAKGGNMPQMSKMEQVILYMGLVIGVFFSSVVTQFREGNVIGLGSPFSLIISSVVALMIAPIAFEKFGVNADSPFIARFGLYVQQGVFWNVLLGSVGSFS